MSETIAASGKDYNNKASDKPPLKRAPFTEKRYIVTLAFVVSLFLLWGIAITMGDVLNRHFQKVLHVSKAKYALVQFSMVGAEILRDERINYFKLQLVFKAQVRLHKTLAAYLRQCV